MLVIRFFNFSARFTFQRTCLPARLTDMKRLPIRELTPVGSLSCLNICGHDGMCPAAGAAGQSVGATGQSVSVLRLF